MKINLNRNTSTYQIGSIKDQKVLNEIKDLFKNEYDENKLPDCDLWDIVDEFEHGEYEIYIKNNELILVPVYHDQFPIKFNIKDFDSLQIHT